MKINQDFLKDITLASNQIIYQNSNVKTSLDSINTTLNNLSKVYQAKVINDRSAWSGTVNKLTLPVTRYGYYLIISMTPYSDFSMYLFFINNTSINIGKVYGTNSTFSINGKELTVTLAQSGYWNTFALYLGTV